MVITWNEESRLRTCLTSVAWADEIVVVDAGSQDKTIEVAREFTDHVVVRPWPGFAEQKNFALAQATGDWILSIDADEEVSAELAEEIRGVLAGAGAAAGYAVPRRNIFWGQWVRWKAGEKSRKAYRCAASCRISTGTPDCGRSLVAQTS